MAEGDDITLALAVHEVTLAKGRVRFDLTRSSQGPLLEHGVGFLARTVKSAVTLLKFLVRQTRLYWLHIQPDVRNATVCSREAPLPPHLNSPSLRFEHYLTALDRLSAAAQTLQTNLERCKAVPSWRRDSKGRSSKVESSEAGSGDIAKMPGPPDPSQSPGSKFTTLQGIDARPVYRSAAGVASDATAAKKSNGADIASMDAKLSTLDSTMEARPLLGRVENGISSGSGSTSDSTQDNEAETDVHLRGGCSSTMDLPASPGISDMTYSEAFSESLLTKSANRIEYPEGEVTKFGAGESYRPAAHARPRSPHSGDTFRSERDRSPRRDRARSPPPSSDSYHPGAYCERCFGMECPN